MRIPLAEAAKFCGSVVSAISTHAGTTSVRMRKLADRKLALISLRFGVILLATFDLPRGASARVRTVFVDGL